ncbi:DUF4421 family protein [Algoriphagus aestuarii]|nr:DUF4421 family protein [Algoriphagus aestuarii]
MALKPFLLFVTFTFLSVSAYPRSEKSDSELALSDTKLLGKSPKDQLARIEESPEIARPKNDTIPTSEGVIVEDGFIEKMDNYLAFRLSLVNDNERFSVNIGPTETKIYPNGSSVFKLNLNYRFLSFGFKFIPKFLTGNDDDILKGKTTGLGFSTGLNFTHWVQEISYTRTTGYYLENTGDFDPEWSAGDPYLQFPNLHYRSFQGITGYNFNQHFSTKALLTGTERQLKSAGTFLPTLLYRYYIVDNREEPTGNTGTQKSKNFEIIANAGYYYTHVIQEKFYASAGASLGYGLLSSKVITRFVDDRDETKQNNGVFKWDARGALGYNGERFFSGMIVTAENRKFKQQKTSVINTNWRVYLQFHVGFRITAPNKLRSTMDAIPFVN